MHPTASTTAALAIGDALAMTLLVAKGFRQEDFANLHPGGKLGKRLMRASLEIADACGHDAILLIGDPEYYGRFFGFTADRTGGWRLPGPFEPHRLLARGDTVPDCAGMLGPRVRQPA